MFGGDSEQSGPSVPTVPCATCGNSSCSCNSSLTDHLKKSAGLGTLPPLIEKCDDIPGPGFRDRCPRSTCTDSNNNSNKECFACGNVPPPPPEPVIVIPCIPVPEKETAPPPEEKKNCKNSKPKYPPMPVSDCTDCRPAWMGCPSSFSEKTYPVPDGVEILPISIGGRNGNKSGSCGKCGETKKLSFGKPKILSMNCPMMRAKCPGIADNITGGFFSKLSAFFGGNAEKTPLEQVCEKLKVEDEQIRHHRDVFNPELVVRRDGYFCPTVFPLIKKVECAGKNSCEPEPVVEDCGCCEVIIEPEEDCGCVETLTKPQEDCEEIFQEPECDCEEAVQDVVCEEKIQEECCDEVIQEECCDEVIQEECCDEVIQEECCDEVIQEECCDEVTQEECCDEVIQEECCDEVTQEECCDEVIHEEHCDEEQAYQFVPEINSGCEKVIEVNDCITDKQTNANESDETKGEDDDDGDECIEDEEGECVRQEDDEESEPEDSMEIPDFNPTGRCDFEPMNQIPGCCEECEQKGQSCCTPMSNFVIRVQAPFSDGSYQSCEAVLEDLCKSRSRKYPEPPELIRSTCGLKVLEISLEPPTCVETSKEECPCKKELEEPSKPDCPSKVEPPKPNTCPCDSNANSKKPSPPCPLRKMTSSYSIPIQNAPPPPEKKTLNQISCGESKNIQIPITEKPCENPVPKPTASVWSPPPILKLCPPPTSKVEEVQPQISEWDYEAIPLSWDPSPPQQQCPKAPQPEILVPLIEPPLSPCQCPLCEDLVELKQEDCNPQIMLAEALPPPSEPRNDCTILSADQLLQKRLGSIMCGCPTCRGCGPDNFDFPAWTPPVPPSCAHCGAKTRGDNEGCVMCSFTRKARDPYRYDVICPSALNFRDPPCTETEDKDKDVCNSDVFDMRPDGKPVYEGGMCITRANYFLWKSNPCENSLTKMKFENEGYDGFGPAKNESGKGEEAGGCEKVCTKYRGGMSIEECKNFIKNPPKIF